MSGNTQGRSLRTPWGTPPGRSLTYSRYPQWGHSDWGRSLIVATSQNSHRLQTGDRLRFRTYIYVCDRILAASSHGSKIILNSDRTSDRLGLLISSLAECSEWCSEGCPDDLIPQKVVPQPDQTWISGTKHYGSSVFHERYQRSLVVIPLFFPYTLFVFPNGSITPFYSLKVIASFPIYASIANIERLITIERVFNLPNSNRCKSWRASILGSFCPVVYYFQNFQNHYQRY